MTSERGLCTIVYPDGERCDRADKGGGLCSGHQNRRAKLGDPLAGGKLGTRRKPGTPCVIGRQAPWLNQPECPGEHYSLGFCSKHYMRNVAHGDPLTTLIDREHGPTCTFPGCDDPYDAAGLCKRHYGRAWLHDGDPLGGTRINSLAERLWRRTKTGPTPPHFYNHDTDAYDATAPCPCRDWTSTLSRGYGVVSDGNVTKQVHRVTYEQVYGPIPEGLDLDHLCRRTVCCEPRHLEAVTTAENSRRQWRALAVGMSLEEVEAILQPAMDAWANGLPLPPITPAVEDLLRHRAG